ncbi:MAG: hypothetical protein BGO09_10255 [Bacteroidetes bacterium 47-18]|nr:MAG: hypothetical protein BGO09_10255 [Bacteroidetes bacterium 47-18]
MVFNLEKFISYYEKIKKIKKNEHMLPFEKKDLLFLNKIAYSMAKFDRHEVPLEFYEKAINSLNIDKREKQILLDMVINDPGWYYNIQSLAE